VLAEPCSLCAWNQPSRDKTLVGLCYRYRSYEDCSALASASACSSTVSAALAASAASAVSQLSIMCSSAAQQLSSSAALHSLHSCSTSEVQNMHPSPVSMENTGNFYWHYSRVQDPSVHRSFNLFGPTETDIRK